MAAPNIVAVTSIYGKTTGLALTTSAQEVVGNAASSGKVIKVNTLTIANVDGVNAADVSVYVYRASTNTYYLAKTISVAADKTLVVISKNSSIYLEEDDQLMALASANSDLEAVCSYEEIA